MEASVKAVLCRAFVRRETRARAAVLSVLSRGLLLMTRVRVCSSSALRGMAWKVNFHAA